MMLIAQGASAAINLGKAAHQAHKASKLGATERPEYQIPQAQMQALNNAKYMASQTELPGQNIMQQRIDQGSAGALSNLKDVSQSGSALGANIANIYRGNVGAQNQLNLAGAQNWNANQANLRNELGNMATAEDRQWTINKFDPYRNNMAASSALREGAFRNLSSAGSDIAAMGAGYANMKMAENPYGISSPTNIFDSKNEGVIGNAPTKGSDYKSSYPIINNPNAINYIKKGS